MKETSLVEVNYVEFNGFEPLELFHLERRYSYKRKSFEHERELRLMHMELAPSRPKTPAELALNPPISERPTTANVDYDNLIDFSILPAGQHLQVDLGVLVENVVLAPRSPAWFVEVVRDVSSRYGQSFPINTSSMTLRPKYGHY